MACPGGLSDFVRGAQGSPGGCSIVAAHAEDLQRMPRGIVSLLDQRVPVTISGNDADLVGTEFGIANVRDLSMDQRAEAIIAIAAPVSRADLVRELAEIRDSLRTRTR